MGFSKCRHQCNYHLCQGTALPQVQKSPGASGMLELGCSQTVLCISPPNRVVGLKMAWWEINKGYKPEGCCPSGNRCTSTLLLRPPSSQSPTSTEASHHKFTLACSWTSWEWNGILYLASSHQHDVCAVHQCDLSVVCSLIIAEYCSIAKVNCILSIILLEDIGFIPSLGLLIFSFSTFSKE